MSDSEGMSDDQGTGGERPAEQQTEPGSSGPVRPTGGRQRVYESAAERSRAWRERQREQRENHDAAPPLPSMAESTLGVLLDRLVEMAKSHEATMGELAHRIEGSVSTLADPDAVAGDLSRVRAEMASQLRAAEDRVDETKAAQVATLHAQQAAETERDEAVDAAAEAWERVEAAEGEVARLRAEMEAVGEAAAEVAQHHELSLEGLRIEYEAALAEATEARQRAEGATEQLRAELVTLVERHEAQITTLRSDVEDAVAGARIEGEERLRVGLQDQAAHLAELHQGELSTALAEARAVAAEAEARNRGELAQVEAAAAGAKELAEARLEEIGRLVVQMEGLRADLNRGAD